MSLTIRLIVLVLLSSLAQSASAQVQDIVRMVIDHAANQPQNTPAQTNRPTARPSPAPTTRQQKTQTTQRPRPKATPSPEPESSSTRRFDGTWLATRSDTGSSGDQISQIFTLVIKDGKAVKTLDSTNVASAEKPFYESTRELRRTWTYNSSDCIVAGSSITIQWPAGQLADWSPKSVPQDLIASYGNPNAETSVYTLKGDELTRINDPKGLTYHRVK